MTRNPSHLVTMRALRGEIDRIDGELVALLAARAACIDRAVEIKRAEGLPARIDARVEEVIANSRAAAHARGLDPDTVGELWRQIVEWSIAREERALAHDHGGAS